MRIEFILRLADRLDKNIFKSWEDALEYYIINFANFPETIQPDFFSLIYLLTYGDSGLVIDENYKEELKIELKHFFPNEDWLFNNIVDSDKDLEDRSKDLGEYLFGFYQSIRNTELGIYFINEYKYKLVEELISNLYIYSSREDVYDFLGKPLLTKLKKYMLL